VCVCVCVRLQLMAHSAATWTIQPRPNFSLRKPTPSLFVSATLTQALSSPGHTGRLRVMAAARGSASCVCCQVTFRFRDGLRSGDQRRAGRVAEMDEMSVSASRASRDMLWATGCLLPRSCYIPGNLCLFEISWRLSTSQVLNTRPASRIRPATRFDVAPEDLKDILSSFSSRNFIKKFCAFILKVTK